MANASIPGGYQPAGPDKPQGPPPSGGSSVHASSSFTQPFNAQQEIIQLKLQVLNLEMMAAMSVQLLQLLVDRGIRDGSIYATEKALAVAFLEKLQDRKTQLQMPVEVRWGAPGEQLRTYQAERLKRER